MTDLSTYEFVKLWEDDRFVLSRATCTGEASLLVSTLTSAELTSGGMAQLQRAFTLRAELHSSWAARPSELGDHRGRPALISEDPGADLLASQLLCPWSGADFLRMAIGLAAALRQLHARAIVHKDIKPANVLANLAGGGVWLTGFGIASRLPRERQLPEPPEVIAGTLAYMAPEQTGRMNRSIDSRSDLYAFGVTLYEVLTGTLPFTASDPMEWVHCHVARQPPPLQSRARGIPGVVSDVVMKLLAKTAEDRYQTAAGVEHDLRRALDEWRTTGQVQAFVPGGHDASECLLIPEKLYGRDAETEVLLASLQRVVDRGDTELVLVSGYSGIGKSSVVNELHRVLVPPRGLFAAGKFDQYKRDIPYATLAQAFAVLVRQVLTKDEAEIRVWREKLSKELGRNGQLICNLVPELEFVVGKQPPAPELSGKNAQARFQAVVRRFLSVFAQAEHPLALFLDDLQWLDAATLDLLEHLVCDPEVRHLLIVGAYRDNEVDAAHPLTATLEKLRRESDRVREIVLSPLEIEDVAALCGDALHLPHETVRPLAALVHGKTGGNPFFAIQFITALVDERLLVFEPDSASWRWDLDAIRAKGYTDNVVDLMAARLDRLPLVTRSALRQLACLGNRAGTETLGRVYGLPADGIHAAFADAVIAGFVLRAGDEYSFLHDRVQEAAYALIPDGERAREHLRIGRILAQRWVFDTRVAGSAYVGQGNHQVSAGDVDGDGKQEIVLGSLVLDDDGGVLYSTDLGHGDAMQLGDFDPNHPGLELFSVKEDPTRPYQTVLTDAATGAVLWGVFNGADTGRGLAADIDPSYAGSEAWGAANLDVWSAKGTPIGQRRPSINFAIWWDGDPLRELLDQTSIRKWDYVNQREVVLLDASGTASNNGSKATPCLQADLFGDWREEVVLRSADNTELRIYTTSEVTPHRIPTLMHDPQYRVAVAAQNSGYNQPPNPGFFIGNNMPAVAMPEVFVDPVPVFLGVKDPDDHFITPVVVLLNVNRGERLRNEYRIDAGAWTAYSMPFVVSGRGPHSVGFRTRDSVGNLLAEASRTLIIGR